MALPELPDDRRAQPRRYGPGGPVAQRPAAVPPPDRRPPAPPRAVPGGQPVPRNGQPPMRTGQPPLRNGQPPVRNGRPLPPNGPPPATGWRPLPPPVGRGAGRYDERPTEAVPRVPPGRAGSPYDEHPTDVVRRPTDEAPDVAESDDPDDRAESGPGRRRRAATGSPDERPASAYRAAERSDGRSPKSGRRRRPAFWKELPLLVVVALLLTFLIQTFLAKVYVIPSGSMETTLHGCTGCNNDRVLVDKVTYRFGDPQPGDVVVFRGPDSWRNQEFTVQEPSSPLVRGLQELGSLIGLAPPNEKDFVKRVIAVGGQTVACCDPRNRVLVDGQPLEEPYLYYLPEAGPARQIAFGPVQVPPGELWLMGDSRNNSADSRVPGHGPVPVENVIGKAQLIVLPIGRFGVIEAVDPHTTAVGMAADAAAGAPVALGMIGVLPLALRRRRDDLDAFLPRPRRRR